MRIVIVPYVRRFPFRDGISEEPYQGYRATFAEVEGIGKTPRAAVENLKESYFFFVSVGLALELFPCDSEVRESIALVPAVFAERRRAA